MNILYVLLCLFFFRIEYFELDSFDLVFKVVFGQLLFKVVIVIIFNVEFNVLFLDLKGFRYYDYKFEWIRVEF